MVDCSNVVILSKSVLHAFQDNIVILKRGSFNDAVNNALIYIMVYVQLIIKIVFEQSTVNFSWLQFSCAIIEFEM